MHALPTKQDVDNSQPVSQPGVLKNYQLKQCLGEGGFGQVFEAWDSKLLRSVAIKRLKPGVSGADGSVLLREARLAASLSHPAFVKIHALEESDDHNQLIVMEMVRGVTLKQLLAETPPVREQALDMVRQIAEAMCEAHAAGLTHGDLKPSNIMVEPSGQVRILDFGLAAKSELDATTSLLQIDPQGTIAYMAPERLQGARLTPQCDIYALGVILFECLAGQRPFAHLSGLALAAAKVQTSSEQWPWPETISPTIKALIMTMTARVPDERVQTMRSVVSGLAGLHENCNGGVPEKPVLLRAERKALASTWLRRPLVLLLAAMLSGAGAWQSLPWMQAWWQENKPHSEALEMKNGLAALKLFDRPGSLDRAESCFNTILRHNPKNAAAVAGMAIVYHYRYRSDDHDPLWLQKAAASMQYAMSLNDQLVLSHVARAMVLGEQGKWEEALLANQRALTLDQSNNFAMWNELRILIELQRYAAAVEKAKEFIRYFPNDRMLFDFLGEAYHKQGNYQAAEKAYRDSIRVAPDSVAAYSNLAYNLFWQNRNDEGLKVLQDGLQIRPNFNLYTNLGNALFVKADYVGAAAAFEHAVSVDGGKPGDYLGWANLADTLLWLPGRRSEAAVHYEKARALLAPRLDREKNNPVLLYRMGLYCARLGKKEEAVPWLQQALKLAPEKAVVHFRVGLAYELLGERQVALSEMAKAVKLGYPTKLIEAEPDLLALRRDPNYLKN